MIIENVALQINIFTVLINFVDHVWTHYDESYHLPARAVWGGLDEDGHNVYIGHYLKNDKVLPTKIIPEIRTTYDQENGKDVPTEDFGKVSYIYIICLSLILSLYISHITTTYYFLY